LIINPARQLRDARVGIETEPGAFALGFSARYQYSFQTFNGQKCEEEENYSHPNSTAKPRLGFPGSDIVYEPRSVEFHTGSNRA
jgi:hypothetical protein